MKWETVIGLETHVELATRSKIFCSCSTAFGGEPNTRCCPVCLGLPGSLPVLNEAVVACAVKAGLALGCEIAPVTRFDRKNYFYPDLPKAYQISQLYAPIGTNGALDIGGKVIGIHELHMEEDAGKLTHGEGLVRVDYNRCGVPLIEIVTEPDFRTAEEVIAYLERLREVLRWLEVSDCKMQEGSLRVDVNLSVRPVGSLVLGTRTEMKNLGSFRAVARAIAFESARQIALIEGGGTVVQETRRWDEAREESLPMRVKEDARDYRYFPEPDLPPVVIGAEYVAKLRHEQPELPGEKRARYRRDWGLPEYDCQMLTSEKALSAFFEELVALGAPPKQGANWIMGQVLAALNEKGISPAEMRLTPATLARLIARVEEGRLNRSTAVKVLEAVFDDDGDVDAYVTAHGLEQVRDTALVEAVAARVLAANPQSAADWRGGKEKAFGFLVGQAMRELKGKADPQLVRETLSRLLNE